MEPPDYGTLDTGGECKVSGNARTRRATAHRGAEGGCVVWVVQVGSRHNPAQDDIGSTYWSHCDPSFVAVASNLIGALVDMCLSTHTVHRPSLGVHSSADASVIRAHFRWMRENDMHVCVISWWSTQGFPSLVSFFQCVIQ